MSLTSIDTIKSYLQISNTLTDALITIYANKVESEIGAMLNRTLASATYTQVLQYPGSQFDQSDFTGLETYRKPPSFFLENYPVTSITLIANGTTATSTDYTLHSDSGIVELVNISAQEPTATYVAGWTTASFPSDLQGIVLDGVYSLYTNLEAATQGSGNVQSKKILDFSVNYGNKSTASVVELGNQMVKTYLAANMEILQRYIRYEI